MGSIALPAPGFSAMGHQSHPATNVRFSLLTVNTWLLFPLGLIYRISLLSAEQQTSHEELRTMNRNSRNPSLTSIALRHSKHSLIGLLAHPTERKTHLLHSDIYVHMAMSSQVLGRLAVCINTQSKFVLSPVLSQTRPKDRVRNDGRPCYTILKLLPILLSPILCLLLFNVPNILNDMYFKMTNWQYLCRGSCKKVSESQNSLQLKL